MDAGRAEGVLHAHAGDVLAYLVRRTGDAEDAADALSEVFTTAWRRRADLPNDPEQARMWLFVTARHVLANQRRGQQRAAALAARLREELAEQARLGTVGAPAGDDSWRAAVHEAVAELPAAQRELVALVHWDGFTISQAAQVVGVRASTARSRYAAARATLAERLGPPGRLCPPERAQVSHR